MSQVAAPGIQLSKSIVKGEGGLQSRYIKDSAARWVVLTGGLGVIVALMLIFVYLLSEVLPLFTGAEFKPRDSFKTPAAQMAALYVAAEEQGEVGMRVLPSGDVAFFKLHGGEPMPTLRLPVADLTVAALTEIAPDSALVAAQLSDGSVLPFKHHYNVTYPDNKRLITPELQYPYGETPLAFSGAAGKAFTVRENGDRLFLAGIDSAGAVQLKLFEVTENLMGETSFSEAGTQTITPPSSADILLMDPLTSWLYVIDRKQGRIAFYKLNGIDAPELVNEYKAGHEIVAASYLSGGISIVVAQADGVISQWFPANNDKGEPYLARVREFEMPTSSRITVIAPEVRRRGFAVGDESGHVSVFYATSGKEIYTEQMLKAPVTQLAFNSRANYMMAGSADGEMRGYDVHNEHPEVSMSALWGKVWYESYDESKWLWQSSSASSDFEPKFSMTPLAVGTLKGAFYAMIFAIPLAVLGAIFTANFMSAEMRQVVKPSVEVLAALPSVILGFLAGLWLAPFVETNLPGVFLVLLFLPLSIPIFGYLWTKAPRALRLRIPSGWEAALLIPVIALVVWTCFAIAKPIEALVFAGNMQAWMDAELGIGYDQRNALVVGIAMGVAVIPVIFSIAEDAIFTVPKQLTLGSLALGATPWQTLIGVVLPTASPGIFSAIMIGMGRAVGETMIVLMATGNTPVTDFSMFQGMRTLAANVAVEMPESEVGSTHFRMLFMAGLVLFIFTFVLNTIAEVVRQRLRNRYGNI